MAQDGLTDEQMDKLKQFQEITNLEETEMAIVTLESLDWNLERAIEAHLSNSFVNPRKSSIQRDAEVAAGLDIDDFDMAEMPESSSSDVPPAEAQHAMEIDAPPPRVARRPLVNLADVFEAEASTASTASSFSRENLRPRNSFGIPDNDTEDDDDEFFDADESERNILRAAGGREPEVPLIPTDCASPLEATQNFASVFEARYGQNGMSHRMPPFFVGSLSGAIREAFECPGRPVCERRPLALYLHSDKAVGRNIFATQVLCSDAVVNLLRMQFVLWPWDITAKENELKLINWLSENGLQDARNAVTLHSREHDRFPLLLLLIKDAGSIQLIDICMGTESTDTAMEKMLMAVDNYARAKTEMERQEVARIERDRLREEQQAEYQKSLALDKEKAMKKEKEENDAKMKKEAERMAEEAEQAHRESLAAALPSEPSDGPDAVAVRFRLPEGGQLMRRFRKSEKLSVVLSYLESQGFPVATFRFWNSDFPKKDVSEMSPNASLTELKWPGREQIHVEER